MSLELEVLSVGNLVETALGKCREYLRSKLEKTTNGELVFTDQPDQGPPYLGTYGASCAALALLAAGADRTDPLVRDLLKYLCTHQMDSGGWTIRSARNVGLTTACAFSLIAFGEAGIATDQEQKAVSLGVGWLIQNARNRGWPFYEGGSEIGITPTALAVRALRRVRSHLPPAGFRVLQNGCSCLEKAFSQNGAIPGRAEGADAGCLATTSVALVTLVECEYRTWADPVLPGMQWLRQQTEWQDDNSDSFYYYGTREGQSEENIASGHVNYVHFTSALMLQALMECEVDIIEPVVRRLVTYIIGRQKKAGDWRSDLAPRETPTWMEMDAALALSRFSRALVGIRPTLKVREELVRLDSRVGEVTEKMTTISTEMQARTKALEVLIEVHHDALVVIQRLMKITGVALPFLPVCAIVGGYIYVRTRIASSNWVTDVLAVLLSALSLLPPLFKARQSSTAATMELKKGASVK